MEYYPKVSERRVTFAQQSVPVRIGNEQLTGTVVLIFKTLLASFTINLQTWL